MARVTNITWTQSGGINDGSTDYLDVGNTIFITYTILGLPHPQLTDANYIVLANGVTAYYDASASNTPGGTYVFKFVVSDHTPPGGLGINDTTIQGGSTGTINYGAHTSSAPANGVTYNVQHGAPYVINAVSSRGTFGDGDQVTITLTTNKPVEENGGSTLTLSNGATATLQPQLSTGTKLVYFYNVQAGADGNTRDLTVTGVTGVVDAKGAILSYIGNPSHITTIICFMPGTLIRTPDGEQTIESLTAGDLVLTSEGDAQPVLWIGRQTVSTVFADPLRVLPVRITEGALDDNLPVRDLLVSPDHALLVDGVLIQAGALVNGTTIRRESNVPVTFTYYHVELADHALILAEGVPAETFVDNVDRMAFDNWDEHLALHPEGRAIAEMALPRAKAQRQVPMATRARLAQRANMLQPAAA